MFNFFQSFQKKLTGQSYQEKTNNQSYQKKMNNYVAEQVKKFIASDDVETFIRFDHNPSDFGGWIFDYCSVLRQNKELLGNFLYVKTSVDAYKYYNRLILKKSNGTLEINLDD